MRVRYSSKSKVTKTGLGIVAEPLVPLSPKPLPATTLRCIMSPNQESPTVYARGGRSCGTRTVPSSAGTCSAHCPLASQVALCGQCAFSVLRRKDSQASEVSFVRCLGFPPCVGIIVCLSGDPLLSCCIPSVLGMSASLLSVWLERMALHSPPSVESTHRCAGISCLYGTFARFVE